MKKAYRARLTLIAGSVLAFSIIFFTQVSFIKPFGVNLPFWDEWGELLSFLDRYQTGKLGVGDFFQQHNEHRILLARIAFLGIFYIFGELNAISYMIFSAFLYGVCAAIWVYSVQRLGMSLWAALISCLILVSPVQYENILWGFQIHFYILVTSAVLGICTAAVSETLGWRALAIAILACFGATFSIVSGLFVWGVVFICLFLRFWLRHGSVWMLVGNRSVLSKLIVFIIAASSAAMVYLYKYNQIDTHNNLHAKTIVNFLEWVNLALSYPVLWQPSTIGICAAIMQWTIILSSVVLSILRRADTLAQKKVGIYCGYCAFLVSACNNDGV